MSKPAVYLHNDVLSIVFSELTKSDLSRCIRCCKQWASLSAPLLYRDVVLTTESLGRFTDSQPSEQYLRLLQTLTLRPACKGGPLSYCGGIFETTWSSRKDWKRECDILHGICQNLQSLAQLMGGMSSLKCFSFKVEPLQTGGNGFSVSRTAIDSLLKALPMTCRSLELDTLGLDWESSQTDTGEIPFDDVHLCETLRRIIPRLEHLSLRLREMCEFVFRDFGSLTGLINRECQIEQLPTGVIVRYSNLKTLMVKFSLLICKGWSGRGQTKICGGFMRYTRDLPRMPAAHLLVIPALCNILGTSDHSVTLERILISHTELPFQHSNREDNILDLAAEPDLWITVANNARVPLEWSWYIPRFKDYSFVSYRQSLDDSILTRKLPVCPVGRYRGQMGYQPADSRRVEFNNLCCQLHPRVPCLPHSHPKNDPRIIFMGNLPSYENSRIDLAEVKALREAQLKTRFLSDERRQQLQKQILDQREFIQQEQRQLEDSGRKRRQWCDLAFFTVPWSVAWHSVLACVKGLASRPYPLK